MLDTCLYPLERHKHKHTHTCTLTHSFIIVVASDSEDDRSDSVVIGCTAGLWTPLKQRLEPQVNSKQQQQ